MVTEGGRICVEPFWCTRRSPIVDRFSSHTFALQIKSSYQLCSPMHIQGKTYLSRSGQAETASGVEIVVEHGLYRGGPMCNATRSR